MRSRTYPIPLARATAHLGSQPPHTREGAGSVPPAPTRHWRTALLPALTLTLALGAPAAAANAPKLPPKVPGWPTPPAIAARALVVMDAKTGQILAEVHPDLRVQPASLAKIMTFDLALRAIREGALTPATKVTIGMDAWKIALDPNASRMFLQIGTHVPLRDLLIGLMVPSGDDAAVAIADAVAGSQSAFVAEMNQEARRLGLTDTHFMNASGLGAPGQYSTALDMALLTRHLVMTYPHFSQYTDIEWFTWDHITQQNFNRLIGVVPWVNGLKSGHLGGPDFHLVTTAERGGRFLIGVVLGAPTLDASASESELLLSWAFRAFSPRPVPRVAMPQSQTVYEGRVGRVPLRLAAGPSTSLPSEVDVPTLWGRAPVRVRVSLVRDVVAPVRKGEVLGEVQIVAGRHLVEAAPLVAARAVPRGNLLAVLWGKIALFLSRL